MGIEMGDLLELPGGELIIVMGFIPWNSETHIIVQKADGSGDVWRWSALAAISRVVQRADGVQ